LEVKMPNDSAGVRSLLKDVTLDGAVIIDKRKLLWLLGWGQDRPGAWEELLGLWTEIGQERSTLRVAETSWGTVVLTMDGKATFLAVKDRAK
jgi:hypothetical protein